MQAYREFTSELYGYQDVLETVNAVEQIAASSIHRLKISVAALNAYTPLIRQTMQRLQRLGAVAREPRLMQKQSGRRALCVIGGEQGMAGGMYHQLVELLVDQRSTYDDVIAVGSKVASYAIEEGIQPIRVFPGFSKVPQLEEIAAVTQYLFENFGERFASVDVLYPTFVTLAVQRPEVKPFLPFSFDLLAQPQPQIDADVGFVVAEPDIDHILNRLLTRYIEIAFNAFVMEAKLSELSARTIESENAADKTRRLITDTRHTFFRARERWLDQSQLERFSVRISSV